MPRSQPRRRGSGLVVTALVTVILFTAACSGTSSGNGVAGAGSASPSASSSSGGPSAVAFSRCMRAHGIEDFLDANADGSLSLKPSPGSDLDPNNPQYKKADNACKHHRLGPPPVTSINGGGA